MVVAAGELNEDPGGERDEDNSNINVDGGRVGFNLGKVVGDVHIHERGLSEFSADLWGEFELLKERGRRPSRTEDLASKREGIYLGVLRQKSRHAEVNHWLSVLFIVVGVGIIAAGPIVALARAEVMPLLVSLFGAGFAAVGLWLKAHVRQNDVALEARVDRIEQRVDEDARWEKATTLIDALETPETRDQFRVEAARWMLNPQANVSATIPQPQSQRETGAKGEIDPSD